MHSEYNPETVDRICKLVALGKTVRQISQETGVSLGSIINWTTKPEHIEQYARAREAAADIFEADIVEAAQSVTSETASADRVKIDALKWVAARRAPKKYGERIQQDLNVNKYTEMSDEQLDNIIAQTTERLKQNG